MLLRAADGRASGESNMNSVFHEELERRAVEIGRLCQQCHVLRLELFGSATLDRFDLAHSDLDFLVCFREGCTSLDNYLPLADGLEKLFRRPVDLVIERAVRNPYFSQTINATRRLIYEHREQEAVV